MVSNNIQHLDLEVVWSVKYLRLQFDSFGELLQSIWNKNPHKK